MKLFVPGRLCLFGEHSDWAGAYRRVNPQLEPGYAIAVGTNRGIYAEVTTHPHLLKVKATNNTDCLELAMQPEKLLEVALQGGFFSYVAGVAYQAVTRYGVKGVAIDNYHTDLPVKKGLSSSAAICVLVARAFNRLYQLNLSLSEEMELAYLGERTTPSQCGKLDLACAYGNQPILMFFDGDNLEVTRLKVPQELYLVIVDLGAAKNTQLILSQLNQCYPSAKNSLQENVQKYLGRINAALVRQAVLAIQQGDAAAIGKLMCQAQAEFDRHLIPACPTQLTAPVLHQLLAHPPLLPYIYGGKGVGSQGDGTAQFIVKDRQCQERAIAIIKRDFPQMQCLKLTIGNSLKNLNKG
ncbi:mevalonate kinase [Myxosarcina sp. GI1]|uniref:mevalonate kinase family protein n=1 Tax=Myxosarcina sp. GI1 TaxID=1541065 RepID=UPI0005680064|nr:GHMP kinase [Myxosarcina sp. GI1]